MRLTRGVLRNFMRYRGEHALELGPTVYGVVAELRGDEERSNWLGKTSLFEALGPFVLYGWHRFRTEDEWITKGQDAGGVEVFFDDGLRVVRSRERGRATRLEVFEPGASKPAKDAAGEEVLARRLGLTREDFFATCFFQQKQMARFILARPGDRMSVVAEWLQLAPLERSAERVRAQLASFATEETALAQSAEHARVRVEDVLRRHGIEREEGALEAVGAMLEAAERAVEVAQERLQELQRRQGELAVWRKDAEGARTYAELGRQIEHLEGEMPAKQPTREALQKRRARAQELQRRQGELAAWRKDAEGARTYAELGRQIEACTRALADVTAPSKSELVSLRKAADEAHGALRVAGDEVRRKRTLAAGRFDGVCPVGDMTCPVADALNEQRERNRGLLAQAEQVELAAKEAAKGASSTRDAAERKVRDIEEAKARLASLREQRTRFQAAAERIERDGEPPAKVEGLDEAWNEVTSYEEELSVYERRHARLASLREQRARFQAAAERIERDGEPPDGGDDEEVWRVAQDAEQVLRELRRDQDALTRALEERREIARKRDAVKVQLARVREASLILGRNGAQRRVAEGALAEIEAGANALLSDAGVDLSVVVRWARETKGLASACESCGQPFPASTRVKACERCSTSRGPKYDERLDVELTDRSGAAEDLAGVAFQLSAGAWLRRRRASPWGVAFIDEPFGALDDANRRALASHLAGMLRGQYGFEQAFVIAHNRGIMDALPGRIRVMADGDRSTVEVL